MVPGRCYITVTVWTVFFWGRIGVSFGTCELEELLKYSELSGQFCESLEVKNVEDSADSGS